MFKRALSTADSLMDIGSTLATFIVTFVLLLAASHGGSFTGNTVKAEIIAPVLLPPAVIDGLNDQSSEYSAAVVPPPGEGRPENGRVPKSGAVLDGSKDHGPTFDANKRSLLSSGEMDAGVEKGSDGGLGNNETHLLANRKKRRDDAVDGLTGNVLAAVERRKEALSSSADGNPTTPSSRRDIQVTKVVAQEGGTASLNCEVDTVGEGMVSWTRQRDYYVLTVGSKTLTKDDRFIPTRSRSSKIWSLKIKFVNSSDAGWYECQISTHPPKMRLLHLTVVKAKAAMKPGKEIYVKEGSSVSLTCEVQNVINSAKHVFWYHGDKMINFDDDGNGRDIKIVTDNNSSMLELKNIEVSDSGNYTCSPLLAMPASVMLHVLGAGENPAAMQDGASSAGSAGGITVSLMMALSLTVFHLLAREVLSRRVPIRRPLHQQISLVGSSRLLIQR